MHFTGYTQYVNEASDALGVDCAETRMAAGRISVVRVVADLVTQALSLGKGADVSDTVRRVRELTRAAKIAVAAIERMLALIAPPEPDAPPEPLPPVPPEPSKRSDK